jgi:hypothetical protein
MLLLQQAARSARERRDLPAAADAERRVAEVHQRADLLREVVKQHRALATAPLGAQAPGRPGAPPPLQDSAGAS